MQLIDLISVGKKYLNRKISLTLNEKDFLIIKGENGTGKSTLIKIIAGYIKSDYGLVVRKKIRISYLEENFDMPENMNTLEYLHTIENLKKEKTNLELFELFKIPKNKKINELSKGNRQKLALINLFSGDFDLFILDEPLNGLDENSIEILINYMEKLDKTFIIVTHNEVVFKGLATKVLNL